MGVCSYNMEESRDSQIVLQQICETLLNGSWAPGDSYTAIHLITIMHRERRITKLVYKVASELQFLTGT